MVNDLSQETETETETESESESTSSIIKAGDLGALQDQKIELPIYLP